MADLASLLCVAAVSILGTAMASAIVCLDRIAKAETRGFGRGLVRGRQSAAREIHARRIDEHCLTGARWASASSASGPATPAAAPALREHDEQERRAA